MSTTQQQTCVAPVVMARHTVTTLQPHCITPNHTECSVTPTLERAVARHLDDPARIAGRNRRPPPEGVERLPRQVSGRQQRQLTGQHHARLQKWALGSVADHQRQQLRGSSEPWPQPTVAQHVELDHTHVWLPVVCTTGWVHD